MTWPISFAILIPQINFITNNIFLGHYSPDALGIAGITGVYYLIFSAIGFGLNNGLQALISRRAGENRPEEIGKLFNQGIWISLSIAVLGMIITWTLTPSLFAAFIREPVRLQEAISFIRIRIWGLPFLFIYQMRNALLVGTNQSRLLVFGTLAETLVNVVFDYLLIFGHAGMPEWGLNGAAVASILAEATGMLVIFWVIKRRGISRQYALFSGSGFSRYHLKLILAISAPLIFQHAISLISWEYFFLLIDSHGITALAISNSMRNIFGIFGVITWAFAATTNSLVSNILGQGKPELMKTLLQRIILLSTGISLLVALLMNIFADNVLSIYGQPEAFRAEAIPVLRVISVAMVLMSFSVVFLNAVVGTGNSRITLMIEVVAITFYCTYIYLVLKKYFLPITYGWMSEWLYWTCLFVPSLLYLRSGRWKKKKWSD